MCNCLLGKCRFSTQSWPPFRHSPAKFLDLRDGTAWEHTISNDTSDVPISDPLSCLGLLASPQLSHPWYPRPCCSGLKWKSKGQPAPGDCFLDSTWDFGHGKTQLGSAGTIRGFQLISLTPHVLGFGWNVFLLMVLGGMS